MCVTNPKAGIIYKRDSLYSFGVGGGRECDFNNRDDVIRASKTLAMLHKTSKGYIPPQNSIIRSDLGKLPEYFSKRLEEIKRTKKMAQRKE